MLKAGLSIVFTCFLTLPAAAQMYPPEELQEVGERQVSNVAYTLQRQLFDPLPREIQSALGAIALDMTLYDEVKKGAPPFGAYADSRANKVILPVETLHFWGDMGLIFAWFEAQSCPVGPVLSYLYQVTNTGVRTPPMEAFALNRQRLIADDHTDKLSLRITDTALNFILAHEMGHLYYDHLAVRDLGTRREQERQADDFAMDVLRYLRLQPGGVTYFFLGARYMEGYSWETPFSTHPPTPERLAGIAARLRQNPDTYFPAGLPDARHEIERTRILEMAGTLEGLAQEMRNDVSFGIQTRRLPEFYPMSRLPAACPA